MKNNFSILKTLPLTFFLLIFFISALVLYQLKNEPKKVQSIKSQLIGKNIPKILISEVKYFGLLNQKQNLNFKNFENQIFAVNFFASWCTPCRAEHHLFFEIKKDYPNVFLLGISHKDNPEDSKKYLNEEGNPYSFVGLDQNGKIALEFGVFGLPETFIINNHGKIIFKHMGPLTKKIIEDEISVFF